MRLSGESPGLAQLGKLSALDCFQQGWDFILPHLEGQVEGGDTIRGLEAGEGTLLLRRPPLVAAVGRRRLVVVVMLEEVEKLEGHVSLRKQSRQMEGGQACGPHSQVCPPCIPPPLTP